LLQNTETCQPVTLWLLELKLSTTLDYILALFARHSQLSIKKPTSFEWRCYRPDQRSTKVSCEIRGSMSNS